jgi:hypothetical protein
VLCFVENAGCSHTLTASTTFYALDVRGQLLPTSMKHRLFKYKHVGPPYARNRLEERRNVGARSGALRETNKLNAMYAAIALTSVVASVYALWFSVLYA